MTGHTSDEVIGGQDRGGELEGERATDARSATLTPNQDRGVVQDSPGTAGLNVEHDAGGDGNLTAAELDPETVAHLEAGRSENGGLEDEDGRGGS